MAVVTIVVELPFSSFFAVTAVFAVVKLRFSG
jgi:hypothetical protein